MILTAQGAFRAGLVVFHLPDLVILAGETSLQIVENACYQAHERFNPNSEIELRYELSNR